MVEELLNVELLNRAITFAVSLIDGSDSRSLITVERFFIYHLPFNIHFTFTLLNTAVVLFLVSWEVTARPK